MRPRERWESGEQDLFRSRLDQVINMDHALVKLALTIDWRFLEEKFGAVYKDGPGQPPLPTRLMAGLAILKHTYNLSNEVVCELWLENPYYQYFCGEEFFQHQLPFDRSSMTNWRNRMGEERLQALLQESLAVANRSGAMARPYTRPSAVLCSVTWRLRSAKNRARERTVSSRVKRKPCWSRLPVQARPKAAPVGRWSCWPARWSSSPPTTASPERPCAGVWPRMTSSRGARTCGAFHRSMANTSPAWRMCSTSMPKRPIRSARWCVSTRARPSSSARYASRSRPSRARSSATTASINAMEPPTCSSSSTCIDPGAR